MTEVVTVADAARAAKRASGAPKVTLVYRRTKRQMPADAEEISAATIPPDFERNPRIHRAWRLQHPVR